MKLTTAVLAAGAAVSLTTAVVGARLTQDARHQAERNEAFLTGTQLDWLAQVSTSPALARLGFVRTGHLPFYAAKLMESDVCQRYWKRFGGLRAEEAEGDEQAEHFTRVLDRAAKNRPQAQRAAT
ncbi:peptide transporter permease SapC [Streptomyces sp. NPDC052535]|uniref:peptide transporter permease SapC n=1 Tax=Streptomyces sp. NPDC052535 TaxID=3155531 RepID=UPI00342F7A2E